MSTSRSRNSPMTPKNSPMTPKNSPVAPPAPKKPRTSSQTRTNIPARGSPSPNTRLVRQSMQPLTQKLSASNIATLRSTNTHVAEALQDKQVQEFILAKGGNIARLQAQLSDASPDQRRWIQEQIEAQKNQTFEAWQNTKKATLFTRSMRGGGKRMKKA